VRLAGGFLMALPLGLGGLGGLALAVHYLRSLQRWPPPKLVATP
jgi:hypothetical protein